MSYKTTDGLMRHLRDNGISISGSKEKRQLINTGYFHGYKGYRFFKNATTSNRKYSLKDWKTRKSQQRNKKDRNGNFRNIRYNNHIYIYGFIDIYTPDGP